MKRALRNAVALSPWLYCAVARSRRGRNRLVVDHTSALAVEGHPRSGNTFALGWLSLSWPNLKVASHVHHPAHIARATKLHVPSLVIVREPVDTVLSMLVYANSMDITGAFERWIRFYSSPHLNASTVHIESFHQVRASMPRVIERLTEATDFEPPLPPHSWPTDSEVFLKVTELGNRRFGEISQEKISIPTAGRKEEQLRRLPLFERPSIQVLRRDAEDIYAELAQP